MELEEYSWVFDSLICFLNGPLWKAPLQSFIEEKSLIFEPNNSDDVEIKKVYEEFRNLVDYMLGTYMEDIGITSEQFEIACSYNVHEKIPENIQEDLFQLIWAANDYTLFKRMMMQKNVELQLQALELIEQKYGITPQLFIPNKRSIESPKIGKSDKQLHEPNLEENKLMAEVIKQCEPEEAGNHSFKGLNEEKKYLEEKKEILQNSSHEEILHEKQADANNTYVETVALIHRNPQIEVNDEDVKKRQEYLKAQRDKLIAMKKQVRKKHLEEEVGSSVGKKRPQSARAAEAILEGKTDMNPKTLEIRRALAEKLRSEVIKNKDEIIKH